MPISSSPSSPRRLRSQLSVLLLAGLVLWQWFQRGGPPTMAGSPWGGVGFALLVAALLCVSLATFARGGARLVESVGYGLGLLGAILYLGTLGHAVGAGERQVGTLLPYALLFGLALWLWARSRPGRDAS